MPSIGTISARFEADNAPFLRGLQQNRKALQRQQQEFRRAGQAAQRAAGQVNRFGSILASAGGVASIGLLARTLGNLTRQSASYGATILENSRRLGIQAETLQVINRAFLANGVEQDKVVVIARTLARTIRDGQDGLSTYTRAFNDLGININDSAFRFALLDEQLQIVAASLANIQNESERVALAQTILGRSGAAALPTLIDYTNELERQQELIRTTTELELVRLKALEQGYTDITVAGRALREQINAAVSDRLLSLLNRAVSAMSFLADNLTLATSLLTGLGTALTTGGLIAALTAFTPLGLGFRGAVKLSAALGLGAAIADLRTIGDLIGTILAGGVIGGAALGGGLAIRSIARLREAALARDLALFNAPGSTFPQELIPRLERDLERVGRTGRIAFSTIARQATIAAAVIGGMIIGLNRFYRFLQDRRLSDALSDTEGDILSQIDVVIANLERNERNLERVTSLRTTIATAGLSRLLDAPTIRNAISDREQEIGRLVERALEIGVAFEELPEKVQIIARRVLPQFEESLNKSLDATGRISTAFRDVRDAIREAREEIERLAEQTTETLKNEGIQNVLNAALEEARSAGERVGLRREALLIPFREIVLDAEEALAGLQDVRRFLVAGFGSEAIAPGTNFDTIFRNAEEELRASRGVYEEVSQIFSDLLSDIETFNSYLIRENARTQQAFIDSNRFIDAGLDRIRRGYEALILNRQLEAATTPQARTDIRLQQESALYQQEIERLEDERQLLQFQLNRFRLQARRDDITEPTRLGGEREIARLEGEIAGINKAIDNLELLQPAYLDAIEPYISAEELLRQRPTDAPRNFEDLVGFDIFAFIQSGIDQLNGLRRELQSIGLNQAELDAFNFNTQAQNTFTMESRRLTEQLKNAVDDLNVARRSGDMEAIQAAQRQVALAKALVVEFETNLPSAIEFVRQASADIIDIGRTREQLERLADIARGVGQAFGEFTGSIIRNFNNIEDAARSLGRAIIDNLINNLIVSPISRFFTQAIGGIIPGLQNGGLGRGLSLVGEAGPELVDFRSPGRVYSNDDLANALNRGSGVRDVVFAPLIQSSDTAAVNRALAEAYPIFESRVLSTIQLDARRNSGLRQSLRG